MTSWQGIPKGEIVVLTSWWPTTVCLDLRLAEQEGNHASRCKPSQPSRGSEVTDFRGEPTTATFLSQGISSLYSKHQS